MKWLKMTGALFICSIMLCLLPGTAHSQIGIKLGTTISNIYYTDKNLNPDISYEIDLRPYLGYDVKWAQLGNQQVLFAPYLGVYYAVHLTKRFDFRPELSFTQKGVSFSQYEYERVIYKVKISYLEIPLSISYKFIKKEKFISELYLGGFGAFKLNAVKKVAVHNTPIQKTQLENVKSFDAGIHLGLTFKYKVFENFIVLDLRIFQGLSNIFNVLEDQPQLYFSAQKNKITGFNLTVGYEF